jgi:ribosome-binding protein aMBF1 (putative translation factor)
VNRTIGVAPAAAPTGTRSARRGRSQLRAVPTTTAEARGSTGGRKADESPSDPRARFAQNLRRRRLEAGLSQEALAAAARLHRTEISLLERSERDPRLATIVRLARALGVAAADLLAGVK